MLNTLKIKFLQFSTIFTYKIKKNRGIIIVIAEVLNNAFHGNNLQETLNWGRDINQVAALF